MSKRVILLPLTGFVVLSLVALGTEAKEKKAAEEQERQVQEADVPEAALTALKKLAGSAAITEFSEEIEHGHRFYEGSWKGPDGNVDGLVTETGDELEVEETIAASKVPDAVHAAAEKEAGEGATLRFEKKTVVMYEVHFKKDGRGREIIFMPDGRRFHENGEKSARGHDNKERSEDREDEDGD